MAFFVYRKGLLDRIQALLSFRKVLDFKRTILTLCVLLVVLTFQPWGRVEGQELPVVSLVSVGPSPVREGDRLSVTVRIAPPLPA